MSQAVSAEIIQLDALPGPALELALAQLSTRELVQLCDNVSSEAASLCDKAALQKFWQDKVKQCGLDPKDKPANQTWFKYWRDCMRLQWDQVIAALGTDAGYTDAYLYDYYNKAGYPDLPPKYKVHFRFLYRGDPYIARFDIGAPPELADIDEGIAGGFHEVSIDSLGGTLRQARLTEIMNSHIINDKVLKKIARLAPQTIAPPLPPPPRRWD